jgi:hypothetical protein
MIAPDGNAGSIVLRSKSEKFERMRGVLVV